MVLLLVQAMLLGAFAAAGHVLTDEELAAAYALTGFGDGSVQSNAAYHKGMKPNATWNAMQVSDWLETQKELLKGKKAIFRNSDYDYASRPRAWTVEQEKLTPEGIAGR